MPAVKIGAKPVEAPEWFGFADGGGCFVVDDGFGFATERAAIFDFDEDLFCLLYTSDAADE